MTHDERQALINRAYRIASADPPFALALAAIVSADISNNLMDVLTEAKTQIAELSRDLNQCVKTKESLIPDLRAAKIRKSSRE